jgi:hypothetical protein
MASFRQDPLLGFARGFLTFLIVIMLLVMAGLVVGMPALLIYRDTFLGELGEQYGSLAGRYDLVWAFVAIMAVLLAIVAMGWRFLVLLRRIVDTVASGDPFVPDNGVRLREMGWLTVAAQVATIPAAALGHWVSHVVEDSDFDFELGLGGLLLTVTLFILARVFKRGAEMREELEGTV